MTPAEEVPGRKSDTGTAGSAEAMWDVVMYAAAALVPLVAILWLIRPWESGLDVPFVYGGDGFLGAALIKGVLENGWWVVNPSLGAPGVMNLYEMPGADTLSYVTIRLLGIFSRDWATVENLFYLSGYPAAGLAAAYALRQMSISRLVAACGAVMYALLPYHWMRGESHLFLSAYWTVPLLVLVAFWMDSDRVPLLRERTEGGQGWDLRSRRSLGALTICALGAMSGVYYAFFGCALIMVSSIRAAVLRGRARIALAGLALVVSIGVIAVAQAVPNLVGSAGLGPNPAGLERSPGHAEVYGLKVTQLFLPADGHRIPAFASLKAKYREGQRLMGPYLDNEGHTASLGLLGALGFLVSLLVFVFRPGTKAGRSDDEPDSPKWLELMHTAGFLNLCALLLATVGGFGAMIAVVLPQIRGYNRISIFVAFLSLVALAALAESVLGWRRARAGQVAVSLGVLVLAGLAVLDQTPASLAVPAAQVALYRGDQAMGQAVADALPEGSAVLQLPYMPFPEPGGAISGMQDYDPLRAYLHVDGMRWSYGAMKGRSDAQWQEETASLDIPDLVSQARSRDFDAIWVQLNGYDDGGAEMSAGLAGLLGEPVVESVDGVCALWLLR